VLKHTGFIDVRWGQQVDVFSGSKHESDAAEFETRGITFSATKARTP
jgi:hypothetical protein